MSDRIQITDLLLRTIIGINEEERRNRQDVLINITLYADTQAAGASDDIEDAVNYRTITKKVIKRVEESSFYLVEKNGRRNCGDLPARSARRSCRRQRGKTGCPALCPFSWGGNPPHSF